MRRRTLLGLVVVVVLIPMQAIAGVCFNFTGSGIPNIHVLAIELAGSGGPFFSLVGEDVAVGFCPGQNTFPLTGTAYLRPDGKAAIGVNVHFVQGNTCAPYWVQGTLDPPTFTSGSGFYRDEFGITATINFQKVSCPSLP